MAKIFVANRGFNGISELHSYLVYDADGNENTTNDQLILGGHPINGISGVLAGDGGNIVIETGFDNTNSRDALGSDTPQDRNYTEVDLNGQNALTVWTQMVTYAYSLQGEALETDSTGALITDFDYETFNTNTNNQNSNSITASLLSTAGIDFSDNMPSGTNTFDFIGSDTLLSALGSDTLYGWENDDLFIDRSGGNDNFYGGDALNPVRFDTADGTDTVVYEDDTATGTLNVYDTFRAVGEGDGSTDILYSIEKVRFETFNASNSLDYSNYSSAVEINSYSAAARLWEPGDAQTAVKITEVDNGLFGDEVFHAINFGAFKTTNYDDTIRLRSWGVTQPVTVDAGAGDDIIDVAVEGAIILAGIGADTIKNVANGTIIYTGTDNDQDVIETGANVYIADAGVEDRIEFLGTTLSGAGRLLNSESAWTNTDGAIQYSKNINGDLIVKTHIKLDNGEYWKTYVANYESTFDGATGNTAGILIYNFDVSVERLAEYIWGSKSNQTFPSLMNNFKVLDAQLEAGLGDAYEQGAIDPFVLDLDGDGLEIRPETILNPHFDMNGDGFAERVGWIGAGDAFLARDLNGDNVINDITELFGSADMDGFTALGLLDSNTDGVVDALDADWGTLLVWTDGNSDGITDSGELQTMTQAGLASINVTPDTIVPVDGTKYQITAQGTFTRTDLSTGLSGNVEYVNNMYDTQWLTDVTITPAVAALPQMKGHGTLPSLHAAMSIDNAVMDAVNAALPAMNALDLETLRAAALPVFNAWAASVSAPAGTPGTEARIDVPLLVSYSLKDGAQVVDYGIVRNGVWELASGTDVLDGGGQIIVAPTFEDILAQAPGSGNEWTVLKAEEIQFMERYTGIDLPIGMDTAAGSAAVDAMSGVITYMWGELNQLVLGIASQDGSALGNFFDGVAYSPDSERFEPTDERQMAPLLEHIFTAAPSDSAGALNYLNQWKPLLDVVIENFDRGEDHLQTTYAYLFQNVVAAYENVGIAAGLVAAATTLDIPEDVIVSGEGNLQGTSDADIFYADSTNQTMEGKSGHDSYVFGRDFGQDVVIDIDYTLGDDNLDTIRFAHYNAADIKAIREGDDLILTLLDESGVETVHSVRVVDQFAQRLEGLTTAYGEWARGVAQVVFADGEIWGRVDMAYAVSDPLATDDVIEGTGQTDVLDGGAGNDELRGDNMSDVYIFAQGYGQDTIKEDYYDRHDVLAHDVDLVNFKDINFEDVTFSRAGDSHDLQILVNDTSDMLTIQDQFHANYSGVLAVQWFDRIEGFVFADSVSISWSEILASMPGWLKTDGDDIIHGFAWEDTLDGGAGDDFLSGGEENDIYLFGLGYGNDIIHDQRTSPFSGTEDKIVFNDSVDPASVTLFRNADSDDLVMTLADGSTLTVIDQFEIYNTFVAGIQAFDRIESFAFESDGTIWTYNDVMDQLIAQNSTAGDDVIYGFTREDTLDGGAGNDLLYGGFEGDTYHFGRGYGNDVIFDETSTAPIDSNIDRLIFSTDVTPSDIQIEALNGGEDFVLRIIDTGETITLQKQNHSYALGQPFFEIEEVIFNDGTIWTPQDMRDLYLAGAGTVGDDTIYGFWTNDIIDGGAGNDCMEGGGGGDTYLFGPGSGHDVIFDYIGAVTWTGDDTVEFTGGLLQSDVNFSKDNQDLLITLSGYADTLRIEDFYESSGTDWIESFKFSDDSTLSYADVYTLTAGGGTLFGTEGVDTLSGTAGHDQIFGLAGDDTLHGHEGDDLLDGGTGNDNINGGDGSDQYMVSAGNDIIEDTSGTLDEIVFGAGITLSDLDIYRINAFPYNHLIIEGNDQNKITIFDHFNNVHSSQEVERILFDDGSTYDLVNQSFETRGTASDDSITGITTNSFGYNPDDILIGLEGNDTLKGYDGNDSLDGGTGDDVLEGGDGNDIYIASAGYDFIDDRGGMLDEIVFGAGITIQDLSLHQRYDSPYRNLIIEWGADNAIEVEDHFGNARSDTQIEQIRFDDGSVYDLIHQNFLAIGDENDNILSGLTTNTIGFGIDDTMYGYGGNDTLNARDGNDILYGGGGNDILDGGNGDDILYGEEGDDIELDGNDGNDTIYGGNGNDYLKGYYDDDRLYGEDGDDILDGGYGDDILEGGAGVDTLDGETGDDVIDGGADNDVIFGGSGNDLIYGRDGDDNIDGESGNDTIYAGTGNDIVNGGSGTSTLYGQEGDDTITSDSGDDFIDGGDGADVIDADDGDNIVYGGAGNDNITTGYGHDTVHAGEGDDTVTLGAQNDIAYGGDGNDTLYGGSYSDTLYGGNGHDELYGEAHNDLIYGEDGDDLLAGGDADDTLYGGAGNDEYIFNLGDDDDIIDDESGDNDVIRLGTGITQADVILTEVGTHDLEIAFTNSLNDTITILGQKDDTGTRQIEKLVFDDGSHLLLTQNIIDGTESNDVINGTSSSDIINGYGGDDIISGGDNDDYLIGGIGQDTLFGESGDDTLNGDEENDLLYGGVGNDMLIGGLGNDLIEGNEGNDILHGGIGNDLLSGGPNDDELYGEEGDDILTGGSGDDLYDGGAGNDTINFSASVAGIVINLINGTGTGEGLDSFASIENIIGTSSIDSITGDSANNILTGNAGDDQLSGGNGSDTYVWNSEDGTDTIMDSDGIRDTISLWSGLRPENLIFAETGTNDLAITFSTMSGQLSLSEQRDATGTTQIEEVRFDDGSELNLVRYQDWAFGTTSSETLSGSSNVDDILIGLDGNDTLIGYSGDDQILGSAGNDTLKGNSGNDELYGGDGNDKLYGSTGNDILVGGWGRDTLYGEYNNNILYDVLPVDAAVDNPTLDGSSDKFYGSNTGDDLFIMQAGWNIIDGKGGDDTYKIYFHSSSDAGAGNTIYDGAGNDRLILASLDFNSPEWYFTHSDTKPGWIQLMYTGTATTSFISVYDQFAGFDVNDNPLFAVDTWEFADGTIIDFSSYYVTVGSPLSENFTGTNGRDYFMTGHGGDTVYAGADDDYAQGGAGDDTFYGEGGMDFLFGDLGNDTLYGGAGDDRLNGEDGDDTLYGGDGVDYIHGEDGNDIAYGGAGNDFLIDTGSGNDTFYGEEGNDILTGMVGDDILYGDGDGSETYAGGRDTLNGNAGNDTLYGGGGIDTLIGGQGNDILYGGDGNDKIYGEKNNNTTWNGDDIIYGGAGNDNIQGNRGNDIINGGEGADVIYGNIGADTFVITSDSAFTGIDSIRDFSVLDGDKLNLSDLLSAYDPLTDALSDFVELSGSTNSQVLVDVNGGGDNFVHIATLMNFDGYNVDYLEGNGNLITS